MRCAWNVTLLAISLTLGACSERSPNSEASAKDPREQQIHAKAEKPSIHGLLDSHRLTEARRLIKQLRADERPPYQCRLKEIRQDLDAVRVCEKVLKDNPDDSRIAATLARALHRDQRFQEAEALMDTHYAKAGHQPDFSRAYIRYFERMRDLVKVEQVLEKQLKIGQDKQWSRDRLAQVLMDKGRGDLLEKRFAASIRSFERLLEIQPNAHVFRFYLADAYGSVGRTKDAANMREVARNAGVSPPPPLEASR